MSAMKSHEQAIEGHRADLRAAQEKLNAALESENFISALQAWHQIERAFVAINRRQLAIHHLKRSGR
jgi:hypothetical protein